MADTNKPVAWALYRHDGSLCDGTESTETSALRCAREYAERSGAPSPYTVVPLYRADALKISEHSARLREQMAAARMRCAVLHELDLEDRELPCAACRQRGAELYPV